MIYFCRLDISVVRRKLEVEHAAENEKRDAFANDS